MKKYAVWLSLVVVVVVLLMGGLWKSGKLHAWKRSPSQSCEQQGFVDSAGITSEAFTTKVEGWAFDSISPVKTILVKIGDKEVASSSTLFPRPDVKRARPECLNADRPGFLLSVSVGLLPPGTKQVAVWAKSENGAAFAIGNVAVDLAAPFIQIENPRPISRDAENVLTGWVAHADGAVKVRLLAGESVLWEGAATHSRDDVGRALPAWPTATKSGFEFVLEPARLPLVDSSTSFEFTTPLGRKYVQPGPPLQNHGAIGKVLADEGNVFVLPKLLHINAWAWHPDKVVSATLETEQGVLITALKLQKKDALLSEFKDQRFTPEVSSKGFNPKGSIFSVAVRGGQIPKGLQRLVVRVRDGSGKDVVLPGPLVWNAPLEMLYDTPCPGPRYQVFLPGIDTASKASAHFESLQRFVNGTCVTLGLQTRIEYLRTTLGKKHDYAFDPDFPETVRKPSAELEMTTASLNAALEMAAHYNVPINLVMDGGVWADSKYSIPEYDVVDFLEQDEQTVQWNQFGKSEPDDALKSLAGSQKDPELARMMSLNRYNTRFMNYKKRNLQAAVKRIVEHNAKHKIAQASINLDPDEYINPWFMNKQWYDYNPGTIRQFREWLLHLGPYADGGELEKARPARRYDLDSLNRVSGKSWRSVEEIDPPREKPNYESEWQNLWVKFKRHLVAQHYSDLAQWAHEVGLPSEKIRTSQTFLDSKVATHINEAAQTWSDEAGVSIEGAKPEFGHMGAIFYGPGSRNEGVPRNGESLLDNVRSIDPQWGIVEFHPGNISTPHVLISHKNAYKTLQTLINYGTSRLTPMWGSSAGDHMVHPDHFRSYDVYDQSPFETQFVWWMQSLRYQPWGGLLWPFGNEWVQSDDGWEAQSGAVLGTPVAGKVQLSGASENGVLTMRSPPLRLAGTKWQLKVTGKWKVAKLSAEIALENGQFLNMPLNAKGLATFTPPKNQTIRRVTLKWMGSGNAQVELDEVRLMPINIPNSK